MHTTRHIRLHLSYSVVTAILSRSVPVAEPTRHTVQSCFNSLVLRNRIQRINVSHINTIMYEYGVDQGVRTVGDELRSF